MKTLLVVDDNQFASSALQVVFKLSGYRVLNAQDGQSAFDLALARHPDLILTDWRMPGMDGVTLCEHIRGARDLAQTPVFLMSSNPPPDTGCWNAYFSKPLDMRKLLDAIDEWLTPGHPVH